MSSQTPLTLLVNGCSPGTGNLGVSALLYSLLAGLHDREPDAEISVVGLGDSQPAIQPFGESGPSFDVLPLNHSRRFYSSRSTSNYCIWNRLGLPMTRITRSVRSADAMLDISAGDSFTDLYGQHRFDLICFLKEAALDSGLPLILLPQTYGPFKTEKNRTRAAAILKRASTVWSRDSASALVAMDLLEDDHVHLHSQGVDLAFALPIHRPPESEELVEFLKQREKAELLVGFNVSGLIYNNSAASKKTFSLQADYPQVVTELLTRFLDDSNVNIALVPHVIAETGSYESDVDACHSVRERLPKKLAERVTVVPACKDPRHVKWYISQCDWFCGTRMHSTIAALSAGVPTSSIAYSMKTRGVFETCGVADEVFDPRVLETQAITDQVYQSWCRRDLIRETLNAGLPHVLELSKRQLDQIIQSIRNPIESREMTENCV